MNTNNPLCVKLIHCGNFNPINPEDKEQKNIFFMPMGLFPLADKLQKNGVDVEIIHSDLEIGKGPCNILDLETVDAVGFDLHWVNQSMGVLDTAALIKSIKPGIFIFLGGFCASLFAKEIVSDFPQVDAIIRGDAEIPIIELAGVLHEEKTKGNKPGHGLDRRKLEKVRNLVWKDQKGIVSVNDITYIGTMAEMEKLDFAAVDMLRNWDTYKFSSYYYTHWESFKNSPMFLLESGRGCNYSCTFCGGNSAAQKRINNRTGTVFRSVASCIATMKKAISFGFKTFYTCMESEESDPWYIELFKRVKEEGMQINYGYGCWRIPAILLVDTLSASCQHVVIEISPETAIYQLRKKNKDHRIVYTNEEMEACLDYILTKDNVKVQLFFGFYVAGDTEETILKTVEYILQLLLKYPGLLEIEYANFSTDPGSLFFFNPGKYDMDMKTRNFKDYIKCLKENYVEKKGQQADMTSFKPKNLSYKEDMEIHRKMRLLNYLFTYYRRTVSYLLRKTASPGVIMAILKGTTIPVTPDNSFPPGEIKEILLDFSRKMNVLDDFLVQAAAFEYKESEKDSRISKPTTQLYMDFQFDEIMEKDDTMEAMMDYIKSASGNKQSNECLEVDFSLT